MIFYKIRKIDKNRLFTYIKNTFDQKKLIPIIFYIFWIIQIDFLKVFKKSQNSYKNHPKTIISMLFDTKNIHTNQKKKVDFFDFS